MTAAYLRRAAAAPATRPALTVYATAVLLAAAATAPANLVSRGAAAAGLGAVVVVVILLSMRREMTEVHALVNSQRDELVARIEQLTAALESAGEKVPHDVAGAKP